MISATSARAARIGGRHETLRQVKKTSTEDLSFLTPTRSQQPPRSPRPAPPAPMRWKLSPLAAHARRARMHPAPPTPWRMSRILCAGSVVPRSENSNRAAPVRRRLPLHHVGSVVAGASAQAKVFERVGGSSRRRSGGDTSAATAAALAAACTSLAVCKRDRDILATALAERRTRCASLGAQLDTARAALAERQAENEGLVAQLVRLRRELAAALAVATLGSGGMAGAGYRKNRARKAAAGAGSTASAAADMAAAAAAAATAAKVISSWVRFYVFPCARGCLYIRAR